MSAAVIALIIVVFFLVATVIAVAVGLMCAAAKADREAQRWLNGTRDEHE